MSRRKLAYRSTQQPQSRNTASPQQREARARRWRRRFPKFSLSHWWEEQIVQSVCDAFRSGREATRAVLGATGTHMVGGYSGRQLRVEGLESRVLLAADVYVDDDWAGLAIGVDPDGPGGPATSFGTDSFATIQAGVDAVDAEGTVTVFDGTYVENVNVNKNLSLLSALGRETTTIEGVSGAGSLGAVQVSGGTTGVTIGDIGQGFTIIGTDGNGAIENAAIYFQGAHSDAVIRGNNVQADGDHGLLTEFGATISGFVIDSNEFSGTTFAGANPSGIGFSTQFNVGNNVPRQLVTMGGGTGGGNTSNITFTNNQLTGTAGGISSDNFSSEQGNTLVTIDAQGATITGNTFEGTTTRFGSALRARGTNTTISANDFVGAGMGAATNYMFLRNPGTANGLSTDPDGLGDISVANAFDPGAVIVPGGDTVYIAAAGIQAVIDASAPGSVLQFSGDFIGGIDVDTALTLGGSFNLSGTLTVSASGAVLDAGFSPGVISSGSLTLTSGSTLTAEVNGVTPGTQHDQYVVTGTVDLGGATLDAFGTITATPGDTVVLIDNDLADPVTGTFAGIANGDTISINGQDFVVFYDGGDGNDVVLVASPGTTDVYVDDDWTGTTNGADPDGGGPAVAYGVNAFDNITDALAAVTAGGNVHVLDGTYNESLSITKNVSIIATNVGGADLVAGGAFTGVLVSPGVVASLSGLDISGFTGTGVDAQGDTTITNSTITGGFTGLAVDGATVSLNGTIVSGASIFGVEITAGGTLIADLSEFTGNNTAGIIVSNGSADIDRSVISGNGRGMIVGATGTASVFGSDLSGNTGDAIENASATIINASGNWWGSNVETDVLNVTTGLVDVTPFLGSGANSASTGFEGDFSLLNVSKLGSQVGGGRIQEGINLADPGGNVTVGDGSYNEVVTIGKSLTLEAANQHGAILAPTTGTQQIVVTVAATDVTIDGLAVRVNQNNNGSGAPIAPVGIGATPATTTSFDGLTIQNTEITSIGDSPANWSGSPSLSVRAAGIVLYDSPSGGVPSVTLANNDVSVLSGNSFFQRAVWLAQLNADITGNTLAGAANDLLLQFASDGATSISGNQFVGQHRGGGGGLNISGPNSSATSIAVTGNTFQPVGGDPSQFTQSVVVNQNPSAVPISFTGNVFNGHVVGLSVGNAANVEISGNSFTPSSVAPAPLQALLGGNDYLHIVVDSDAPSGGDSTSLPISAAIDGNIFNPSANAAAIGTAISVLDSLPGSTFAPGGVEIGVTGDNTYNAGITTGIAVAGGVATIQDTIAGLTTGIAISGGSVSLSDSTLTSNTTGISVVGSGELGVGVGNTITGGATGLLFDGGGVGLAGLTLGDLSISGQSGDYITLASGALDDQDLDATGTTLGGVDVSTATPAQLAVLGDKITDEIDDNTLGQVVLQAGTIFVTPVITPTALDNDYTRIKNAIEAATSGETIVLAANGSGDAVFNWDESNAMASWHAGNDGIADGGNDDWTILLGAGQNDVTVTAANLPFGDPGRVAIQGPGDVATANLEGVFVAFGNTTNTGWTFENFDILNFDNAIGFYFAGDDYSDLTVQNMRIQVAADDVTDVNQNIGIHYGRGTNITIENNLFELVGGGDGTTFAIQSNTHGGANYDGLSISGNTINVLNAGDETLYGIWENGHAHGSNISISGNAFNGVVGNTGDQIAFRLTSHSGATSTVEYDSNVVDQATVAFDWLDVYFGSPQDYTGTLPIEMDGNIVTNTGTAFDIGGINASASITGGSITGASGIGVNIAAGNSATVSGVTLENLDIGVLVGGSATLLGNQFDNAGDNLVDVQLAATASSITIDAANTLGGDTYFIENLSTLDLDLTGALQPSFDETDNFRIEDKLYHAPDAPTSGLVRIVGGELFVTTDGTGASDETIQNAIDAADAGDTVNVEAGTFTENVSITKDIDLLGDSGGGTTVTATSGNVFTLSGAGFNTADNEVTIDWINLDGGGTASTGVSANSSVVLGELSVTNADITGFTTHGVGIFGDGTTGDTVDLVTLDSLTFSNNGLAGGGGTGDIQFFTFNNNAALSNLVLVGSATASTGARLGIQFRGVGAGDGTGVLPMGTVSLANVDVSGDYRTQMIGLQRYANVDNLSFSGVALGGVGSEITGGFGASLRFDAVGSGSLASPATFDLGDTLFRGLDGASAQPHEIEFAPDNGFAFLRVDGTDTVWTVGGVDTAAADLTLSEAFEVENRILHYVDKLNPTHGVTFGAYKGFVDIQTNQAFVTDQVDVPTGVVGDGSIQRGIDIVNAGGTVNVSQGTFVENVSIDKNVTLLSESGRSATTIEGISSVGALGTIVVTGTTTDFNLGGTSGNGFTIVGIDNGAPGIENAAVYFQGGGHTNAEVRWNEIVANGDGGLLTEFNRPVTEFVIDSNVFSGKTFVGPEPADNGFGNQFTTANVPRQLVVMGGGLGTSAAAGVVFTNNQITGVAGGLNIGGEQGNTLVTIDAANSVFTGNTFEGITTRFGAALRARGQDILVEGNSFTGTGMGSLTSDLLVNQIGVTVLDNSFDSSAGAAINIGGGAVQVGQTGMGNTIAGYTAGLFISAGTATIEDNDLTDNTTGISVVGSGELGVGVGNTITGGATGLLFDGGGVGLAGLTLGDLSISGQSGDYITLASGALDDQDLDATGTTLGGVDVSTATPAQLAVLGDKITDEIDDNTLGQVVLQAGTIFVTPVITPTALDNDYTRIKNAIEAATSGETIVLAANGSGDAVFNWDESNAMASWHAGNDGIADGGNDDWTILLGAGQNDVTVTAANLPFGDPGRVAIQGPGDVATANLEGVFVAFGNTTNTGWTFENFDILNFDNAIGFYFAGDDYSDLTVQNMRIQVAADDVTDVNQNIGIHYGRGTNITIENNLFELVGGGDGTTFAIQSNTHGGANYDGLSISGNTINVLNAGDETLYGIWENGHAHGSNISISGNAFNGVVGNTGDQIAFRLTSHSGATSTVEYDSNVVDQATVAFDWLDVYFGSPQDYTGTLPIEMDGNIVTNTGTAFDIGGINASASITGGSITGASGIGVNIAAGNSATVSGVTLENLDIGVLVGGSATLLGNQFDNAGDNLVDVQLAATASSITIDAANTLGGDTYFIENLSTLDLDLTGALQPSFDETDNFRIEDKLYHAPDAPTSGLVRIVGGELFVTTDGTGASDETIQNAIDAADAGDTVNVEAGTFTENVSITKDIDLLGDSGGGTTVTATSGNVFTLSGAGFNTADNEVTIDWINLDGGGTASTGVSANSSVVLGELSVTNADITGFTTHGVGIFGDGTTGDTVDLVTLDSLTFSNNGLAGGGGTGDIQFFTFNNNAALSNLVLVGSATASTGARLGIQFRGVGAGDGTGVLPMGTVSLANVDVSGDYRTQMIGLQRYANVDNLSFSGVALGGVGSEITGGFGASLRFDAVGSGSLASPATFDLGDTLFRGLDGASAQPHEIEFAPDNGFAFLRVDGTDTVWTVGGVDTAAADLTLSEAFEVENRILHYVDKLNPTHGVTFGAYKGFVDIQTNQAFVTDQVDVPTGVVGDGSIQRGIDIVNAGGTVNVSQGTFAEGSQIVVDKEVDVIGQGQGVTILNPGFDTGDSGNSRGWWLVESTGDLDISGMTFDGTGNLVYQAFRHLGVGTFDDVEFTEIKFNESGPHYQGVAIAAFGGVGDVDVTNSTFSEIGRVGVLYFGAGTTGTFQSNTYVGKGAGDWLDYALDISAGAVVDVIDNEISGNQGVASSDGSTSAGILVSTFFAAGTVANLSGNEIYNNSTGVFVGFDNTDTSTVTINGDNIHNNVGDGVFAIGGLLTVTGDTLLVGNGGAGVEIGEGAAGVISGNTTSITGNAVGIEVDGGTALVEGNNLNGNTIGVLVQNDGVADLGQTGSGTDFTGLGISTGGNDFSGYTAVASASGGAIVNLNTGGDYSTAGPQGIAGPVYYDVTAFGNTFNAGFATPGAVDTVIYHDTDDATLGFVDYANLLNLTVSLGTLPSVVTSAPIDEGGSVTVSGEFSNVAQEHTVTISWGDGSPDTVLPLAPGVFTFSVVSPASTYTDDPDGMVQTVNNAITVTVEENFGPESAVDSSLAVNVSNVVPVVPLADVDGDNEINEGQTFNLAIGPVIDPGDDTIFAYEIDWGDGTPIEFFSGDPLTSASVRSHVYADGLANPNRTISVNALDEDGTWMGAGTLNIVVNNVASTAANFLAFNSTVNEGSTTNVFFVAPFADPGTPDSPFHFAYDFNGNGVYGEPGELGDGTYAGSPTSSSAIVPAQFLADDDDSPRTVKARIIDNDDGFTEYMVNISILNVDPVVEAGANDTTFPATLVDHVVSFTDPGSDANWTVNVDWDGDLVFDETFNVPTRTFNLADHSSWAYGIGDIGSTFTVTVEVDDNDGGVDSDIFDLTVVEDTLQVVNFATFASGFEVTFNRAIDLATLNLYDGLPNSPSAAADVLVSLGATNVRGSIDWDAGTNTLTFVATGGVLASGSYDVTLRSGSDAFQDLSGSALDGNGDSSVTPGDDYTVNFVVSSAGERVVSLPDFSRGPGQDVNLPATGTGLPIRIDQAAGVTAVDFDLVYDPALIDITGVSLGAGPQAAGMWSVTPNFVSPGLLKLTLSGVNALAGIDVELLKLTADVPSSAPYAENQVIRIENLRVNEDAIASKADYAVHKAAYLGDADGNGIYTGFDSTLISRVVVAIDSGFSQHRWTDPVIVADATGDGSLSGQDASYVAQKAALLARPEIPDIPGVPLAAATAGVDPQFVIGENIAATLGGSVIVPVDLDVLPAEGAYSATFDIFYDSGDLDFLSAANGSDWSVAEGWTLVPNDVAPGQVRLVMYSSTASATGLNEIATLEFAVNPSAALGGTTMIDVEPVDPNEGFLTWTSDDGSVVFTNLPGDYNLNGKVDIADYTVYRDSLGSSVPNYSGADGDGDGVVGPNDYSVWKQNFGATFTAVPGVFTPAAFAAAMSEPEPEVAAMVAASTIEDTIATTEDVADVQSNELPVYRSVNRDGGRLHRSVARGTGHSEIDSESHSRRELLLLVDAVFDEAQLASRLHRHRDSGSVAEDETDSAVNCLDSAFEDFDLL